MGYHRMACTLAATEDLEATYGLKPDPPTEVVSAVATLAWVLATHPDAKWRNGDQALRYAEEMMESYAEEMTAIQPAKMPWFVNVLAASYAEAGRFPQAVAAARQAIDMALAAGQQPLAESIRSRLRLYQANRPYHVALPPSSS